MFKSWERGWLPDRPEEQMSTVLFHSEMVKRQKEKDSKVNENPKADEQKTEMREGQEEHGAVRAVRQDRRPAAAGV